MSMPFGPTERVDQAKLEALAGELAKQIKTEQDIAALSRQLLKLAQLQRSCHEPSYAIFLIFYV